MDGRRWAMVAGAVVLAFLLGFGWQYIRAERMEDRLADTRRELAFTRLEAQLGAATVAAQYGGHDVALELTSDFYTTLQERIGEAPADVQPKLREVLRQRDAIITILSRGEPESGAVLGRLFVRYRIALGGPEQALPIAATPPAGP